MKTKSIQQEIIFDCEPAVIYNLLMNQDKHSEITGSEVIMSNELNGQFSVFDGYCEGYNIELIENQKIVQAWHFDEDGWSEDHYSICTFIFEPAENKTKLIFTQTGIPEHKAEELERGWNDFYWQPIKEYLKNR